MWDFAGVISGKRAAVSPQGDMMPGARFFPT